MVGVSFHLSQTGSGVFHIFKRWAKVPIYRELVQVPSTFSIPCFMPPHRIALHIFVRRNEVEMQGLSFGRIGN